MNFVIYDAMVFHDGIFQLQELYMSPRKEVGLTKNGYLNKAPFHSESDGLFSGKVNNILLNNNYK
jgi:hypothetical protein